MRAFSTAFSLTSEPKIWMGREFPSKKADSKRAMASE